MICRNISFSTFLFFLLPLQLVVAATNSQGELAPSISAITKPFLTSSKEITTPSPSAPEEPSEGTLADDPLALLQITLQPELRISTLPTWAKAPVAIKKESSTVEIPLPPLVDQTHFESFALTVNFNDMGDGGPLIQWLKKDGESSIICSGLGINGTPIGRNSRTLLIPYDLAIDGGTLVVSHAGRMEQIISIIVRPGRAAMISTLNKKTTPALINESSTVIEKDLAEGGAPKFKTGDIAEGLITRAELAAPIEHLPGELEFPLDIAMHHKGIIFRTEIQGLDLDAHIEVELNGISLGSLNIETFDLNAAELISVASLASKDEEPQIAGWRSAYIYLPSYLWKENNNSFLLKIKKGLHPTSSKVHLKNSILELK